MQEDAVEQSDPAAWDTGDHDDDEKVVINVGGIRHETLLQTLISKPGTRLSHLAKRVGKGGKREFFFDRHPGVFSSVMDYYRSGELHVPLDVCGAVVKRELDFWQIEEYRIEACCWISYSSYIDNQKTLATFNASIVQENEELRALSGQVGWRRRQMQFWMILDHPRSSKLAMAYAVTSFLFVLTSIAGFCLETLPDLRQYKMTNVSQECYNIDRRQIRMPASHPVLEYLDYLCTAFFTIELLVRIVFAPVKRDFFRSPMNIIDILALLPLYVQIILDLTDDGCFKNHRAVLETIFVLRIIRIFRIFHLVKHYKALKILVHAIRASIQELLMLAIFLFIAMLVFSTLVFYAERKSSRVMSEKFHTIPVGFWWSIITMTTVGYGDVYPTTALGCAIGAVCALCGVLLIALTIPVISNNFALFYMHARTREQIIMKNQNCNTAEGDEEDCLPPSRNKTPTLAPDEKKGVDSRALLVSYDSNSTTDESGIMMTNKVPDDHTGGSNKSMTEEAKELLEESGI